MPAFFGKQFFHCGERFAVHRGTPFPEKYLTLKSGAMQGEPKPKSHFPESFDPVFFSVTGMTIPQAILRPTQPNFLPETGHFAL